MAEEKKGFILYADQIELFNQLPNDKAGELIKHIFLYVNDEKPKTDDLIINLAFTPIKKQFQRDLEKWEKTRQGRSLAGKASAEARRLKKEQAQQESTNSTNVKSVEEIPTNPTVNDTVNVNDNVTVINNTTSVPLSTTKDKIDFKILLSFINKQTKREFKVINDSVKNKFKARLKEGYSKEDISNTVINSCKDPFHKEHNFKYLTPEYFSRSATMDKFSAKVVKDKAVTFKNPYPEHNHKS